MEHRRPRLCSFSCFAVISDRGSRRHHFHKPLSAAPKTGRHFSGWQRGQKKVLRPAMTRRTMGVPQTGQGSPARP